MTRYYLKYKAIALGWLLGRAGKLLNDNGYIVVKMVIVDGREYFREPATGVLRRVSRR
jgi:hypothetical protein